MRLSWLGAALLLFSLLGLATAFESAAGPASLVHALDQYLQPIRTHFDFRAAKIDFVLGRKQKHYIEAAFEHGESQHRGAEALITQRRLLIAELCCIINSAEQRERNRYGVCCAIKVLGEYQATEAIDSLCQMIDLPWVDQMGGPTDSTPGGVSHWPTPANVALQKIGPIALPAIVANLTAATEGRVQYASVEALKTMLGADQVVPFLEQEMTRAKSPLHVTRLRAAVRLYQAERAGMWPYTVPSRPLPF